ncbi:MAG: peptidase and in kexin sedolisin [Verrucomicrobiales bacterium]|nr:peptidase and in kexin sedolisin [Verrucomicrobiales bacterium]
MKSNPGSHAFASILRPFLLSAACLAAAIMVPRAVAAPPVNDPFASAVVLDPAISAPVPSTTVDSTREADEPIYNYTLGSVWYRWTAPASGWKRVLVSSTETTISNSPAVGVLTGSSPGSLKLVSIDPSEDFSVRFQAVAGTTYYIHVAEQSNTPGAFQLSLADTGAPVPPENDSFAAATVLSAPLPLSVSGNFRDATVEEREPGAYRGGARGTVWYRWTAPAGTDWLDVYVEDVGASCGVNLYTGTALTGLTRVEPRFLDLGYPESFFRVTPGTVYYFQVFQNGAATRFFTLNVESMETPSSPANDSFANRVNLGSGATVSREDGTTVRATTEPGEKLPVESLTSTVWYSWTAPASGAVEVRTTGAVNHDTFLSVYTGSSLESLSPLAFDDDIDASTNNYDSRVVIPVTAGTVYQIQVGSAYAVWDTFALTINPVDSDLQPFRILSFSLSKPTVDVTSAAVEITCDLTLSDLLDNPSDLLLSFEFPKSVPAWGGTNTLRLLRGMNAPAVFVSGTTYRFTFTLPAGLPAGFYPVIVDVLGVSSGFADGLAAYGGRGGAALPGSVTGLTVVNTGTITPAPALTAFTMTPAAVDVSTGDVMVAISAQASGVLPAQDISLTLTDPLGAPAALNVPGLVHDGTSWKGTLTVPKGFKAQVLRPTVTLLNSVRGRDYGFANPAADPLPAGAAQSLTIQNTDPDRLPPQIRGFTFDTTAVSLAAGSFLLTGTVAIEDENRLAVISMGIDDGARTRYPELVQSRISGTSQSGVYRWELLIDRLTSNGDYYIVVGPTDTVGNTLDFSPVFGTYPVGLPFRFTVAHGGEESAESNWMDAQDFSSITGNARRTATAINVDPDGDGIPNLLEFYFGTNPADSSNAGGGSQRLPVFSWTGSALRLDFGQSVENKDLGPAGSEITGQFSTDLGTWTDVPASSPAAGQYRVESPAAPGSPRGFLRLKAAPVP